MEIVIFSERVYLLASLKVLLKKYYKMTFESVDKSRLDWQVLAELKTANIMNYKRAIVRIMDMLNMSSNLRGNISEYCFIRA